jgi:predicted dehydrogenase
VSKIRAVIIGSGLIAGKKHIPAFLKLTSKVELSAVCDLNLQAAQQLANRFGIPRSYGNVAEMLATEKPQLVDICTPPATHVKLALDAMKSGCNLLIEKPMALTVADCDRIVQAARDSGVKVCVGHSDLFYQPFIRARELVAQGAIGRFRGMRIFLSTPTDYMTSRQDHWAHKLPGGVIGESGPHIVYMTLAFLNPIRDVSVHAIKLMPEYPWSRFEDYRLTLVGDQGVSSVILCYTTNQWAAKVELLGDKGLLALDLENMTLLRYNRPELKAIPVGMGLLRESAQLAQGFVANLARYVSRLVNSTHDILISRFADSIINGTEPPVTAEEGREAVRVLSLIVDKLESKAAAAPPLLIPASMRSCTLPRN